MRRSVSFVRSVLGITLLAAFFSHTATAGDRPIVRVGRPVTDQYIVVLENGPFPVSELSASLSTIHGGRVLSRFHSVLRGYVVEMSAQQAESLRQDVSVKYVQENAVISLATSQPISSGPIAPSNPYNQVAPTVSTLWGLDRIDQMTWFSPTLNNKYDYCTTGTGVRAYVVDTGVMDFHKQFCTIVPGAGQVCPSGNRRVDTASSLGTYLASQGFPSFGNQCWDQGYISAAAAHGTAVASILGGKDYGVAKDVTLVDVRVIGCNGTGTLDRVIHALDWIKNVDPNRNDAFGNRKPSVVNMSFAYQLLGSGADPNGEALKSAVNTLVDTYNIKVVTAAGNNNTSAYWYSPGSASRAINVGGVNKASDTRWQYSNYGHNVAFYAPAQYIESAHTQVSELNSYYTPDWTRSMSEFCDSQYPQDYCTSGTSFAAPFTAGLVARYLNLNPTATRDQVVSYLNTESSNNTGIMITAPDGSSARILNTWDCN